MKIAVTTAYDEAYKAITKLTIPTMQRYCKANGYEFIEHIIEESDTPNKSRHPSWEKIKILIMLLKEFDAVLWVDADSVFLRNDPIVFQGSASITFAQDWNGLCCSAILAVAGTHAIDLLTLVDYLGDVKNPEKYGSTDCKFEQNAFKCIIENFQKAANQIALFPPEILADMQHSWRPTEKTWIFHAGGVSKDYRIAALKRYLNK